MLNIKNTIAFLFILFALFLTNRIEVSIKGIQTHSLEFESAWDITQSPGSNENQNLTSFEGILQPAIRGNESNSSTFRNFKHNKKSFTLHSRLQSFLFSKFYFAYYRYGRTNKINTSPFYIAYHRLLI